MTSELPVTQAYAVSDWEMAKQQGFNQAISALKQPTPELVEAVARAIDATRSENDTIYDYARAALAAAAAHLLTPQ